MVRLRSGLEIVEVDDGRVVLDTNGGVYWHLNQTAITMVAELSQGRAFDDLVGEIARSAGVDESRVRTDHLALLDELRAAKLIEGGL
jgi:hypothetical protein